MNDEKSKNLDLAISQIEKQYGKGSIMRLGNRDVLVPGQRDSHRLDFASTRRWAWADFPAGA